MKTTVTELDDSRARVEAVVPAEDVAKQLQRAARALARDMRMPGFRKGKAPPSLVIQRLGVPTVLDQALRDALPNWYERAVYSSGITPIGDPEVEVTRAPEGEGEELEFKFEVGVRPKAQLGVYLGLEVGKAAPEVPDDVIDRELERLREGMARLEPVERAAADGDVVMVDFEGAIGGEPFEGGKASDHTIELGSGQLIEGFEDQLVGAAAGEQRKVEVTFPEDYGAEHLAGEDAVFTVEVKEVREKVLPDLDDDFASEASEFDTLDELREDIAKRLGETVEARIENDFRMAVIDAAVENATVDVPEEIVRGRAQERWDRVERQLAGRGIDPEMYLQMQGKSREEIVEESIPDARRELEREAVMAAIAEAEGIEVSEEEMAHELEHAASHERTTGEKLLARLKRDGRDQMVAEDIRVRKAIDRITESAEAVDMDEAEAREKLWTPEGERSGGGGQLWTPGSG